MINDVISCYTDGSNNLDQIASWAFIAVQNDKIIHQDSGVLTGEICKIRNIGGEIKAVIMAINWAKTNNCRIEICHDLEGIERWGTGKWKCNNKYTLGYKEFCEKNKEFIAAFRWTRSHQKDVSVSTKYNNLVDQLAGDTIKNYDNIAKGNEKTSRT